MPKEFDVFGNETMASRMRRFGIPPFALPSEHDGVPPRTSSMEERRAQAVRNRDFATLDVIDAQILKSTDPGLEDRDPWRAPVRLFEYSAGSRTLTVKPPEPLASFTVRLEPDGSVSDVATRAILRRYRQTAEASVRNGGDDLPQGFIDGLGLPVTPEIIRSPRSRNLSIADIGRAASLGQQMFGAKPAVVFDGLPDPTFGPSGMWQLYRMGMDVLDGPDWRDLRNTISLSSFGPKTEVKQMQPRQVLDELKGGDNDVLVLIAHNDDGQIYTRDGKLAIADIERLRRDTTPNRAIVLITCKAGGVGNLAASLAETLLSNRLAAAVFASTEVVYSSDLPALLADLKTKPLAEALATRQIRHIVSIDRHVDG